ncbi:YHYH protein [Flammeovirga agarivorans]|nr:YHYH protein [Flammeovirga agarivorans]
MRYKLIILLFLIGFTFSSCSSTDADDTMDPTSQTDTDSEEEASDADDSETEEETDSDTDEDTDSEIDTDDELAVYRKIYGATDIYKDGDYVVIEMEGIPDHGSPYYDGSEWQDRYEENDERSFNQNPNVIQSVDRTVRIPLYPTEATDHQATALGTMGVALNGVAFFNQYAGPNNQPLTNEIYSFDQYNGHPQSSGVYHYHLEPNYLTEQESIGQDGLLGFLLDGFPVYGPMENNVAVTNDDLDDYHGHSHETEDYPDGIYHYHITAEDPYINGNGYYGTPGTSTQ